MMIDLHNHLLPGIDDGAQDLAASLEMARAFVADGVTTVACTPHILPGLYANTGVDIRVRVKALQAALLDAGISLELTTGSDAHMVPDFVSGLKSGHLLSIADSRYVLVEPPHHVAPVRLEEFFFALLLAGYVPIITHPERLSWIGTHYETLKQLVRSGVWVQVTAGALTGSFGRRVQDWGQRMLGDGIVHILASDAHDTTRRPPSLSRGRELAARIVGDDEASHLVLTRPRGILLNESSAQLPSVAYLSAAGHAHQEHDAGQKPNSSGKRESHDSKSRKQPDHGPAPSGLRGLPGRLWRVFD